MTCRANGMIAKKSRMGTRLRLEKCWQADGLLKLLK